MGRVLIHLAMSDALVSNIDSSSATLERGLLFLRRLQEAQNVIRFDNLEQESHGRDLDNPTSRLTARRVGGARSIQREDIHMTQAPTRQYSVENDNKTESLNVAFQKDGVDVLRVKE